MLDFFYLVHKFCRRKIVRIRSSDCPNFPRDHLLKSRFGRHRLAASVSPGKSWEGFLGGLLASLALALIVGQIWAPADKLWILALVAPTALISVLGDLLESMVKRHRGVKDSGLILPGHGGVLDRIDGITAAVPVFALTLLFTGTPL